MTRRRALGTLCVWLVLSVSLWATDARPAVFALGAVVLVAAAAVFTIIDLARGVRRIDWSPTPQRRRTGAVDPRVVALRRQIDAARWSGSTQLRDTLVALTDDRLQTHHNIDRSASAAAADVLSPNLCRLVDWPRGAAISVRDLRRIVNDLEEL
ncbi:MAG: hypothetical protein WCK21_07085 [Actinomycetota bacterium]